MGALDADHQLVPSGATRIMSCTWTARSGRRVVHRMLSCSGRGRRCLAETSGRPSEGPETCSAYSCRDMRSMSVRRAAELCREQCAQPYGVAGDCVPLQLCVLLLQLRLICEHADRVIEQDMALFCRQAHRDDDSASIEMVHGHGISLGMECFGSGADSGCRCSGIPVNSMTRLLCIASWIPRWIVG